MRQIVIIMGVSGSGKSTIGLRLALGPNAVYIEGDDFHPEANIAKMSAGQPLNDDDRKPWYNEIISRTNLAFEENDLVLVGCSALKESYRQYLSDNLSTTPRFIHLSGSFETIHERMRSREHFMPANLLKSQFETLEMPEYERKKILTLHIEDSIEDMVTTAKSWLGEV